MGREPKTGGLINRSATLSAARTLLDEAGIAGIEPLKLVADLSLGQQQIVEVVKVISRHPQVLFMDEPTSALAQNEVAWLVGVIRKLREQGISIIFTSHRWNEIKDIADRITVFRNGETVGTYEAAELSEQEAVERMTGRKLDTLYPELAPLTEHTPVLQVRNLSGTGLQDVSLTASRSEVLGIGGLAGQGQHELFLTLFGVNRPHSGTIEIKGHVVRLSSPRGAMHQGIAFIPEDRKAEGLLLPLSVRQNLTLSVLKRLSKNGFLRRQQEADLTRSMIEKLAIRTQNADQPVGTLSGGNQQKVLLGRWLLTQADILLLYDITRGVDVTTKYEIYDLIRQLSEQGRTVLFYSTDTEEMAHLCHRVLVMREGRIVNEIHGPHIAPEAIVAAAIHVPAQVNVEVPQ
jgi:ribose transport system ATP-binding protein